MIINSGQVQRSRIDSIAMTLNVPAMVSDCVLTLHNESTGGSLVLDEVAFNEATNTWDMSGIALTDGYYTATISAEGMATHQFEFHVLMCDTDGDQQVDDSDYHTTISQFGRRESELAADFNNDNRIGIADFVILRAAYGRSLVWPSVLPGDADGNGVVDDHDYTILVGQFGRTGGRLRADFDGNQRVDLADFVILRSNDGNTLTSSSSAAVPELPSAAPVATLQAAVEPTAEVAAPVVRGASQPLDDTVATANDYLVAAPEAPMNALRAITRPILEASGALVGIVSQPSHGGYAINDLSDTAVSAAGIDLLVESPDRYIPVYPPIPAGSSKTAALHLAATAAYDLRVLNDDLFGGSDDYSRDGFGISFVDDHLLPDILAESLVTIHL